MGWNDGPTLTLGPISAAAGSPIGGLFGFAQGISSNYATGVNVAVSNPAIANAVIAGKPVDAGALYTAATTPQSGNPFVAGGGLLGALFGTGTQAIGTTIGTAGATAAPGVAGGASSAGAGVGQVASAGVLSGIGGALQGALAGIGTAGSSLTGASGGNTSATMLYILAGLGLVILYLVVA